MEANFNNISDTREISLKDVVFQLKQWCIYILSRWKILIILGCLGGAVGFIYYKFKTPLYKAELTFALEDEQSQGGLGGALSIAGQFGFDLGGSGGGAFVGDNLLELMKSRSIIEKSLLSKITFSGEQSTLADLYISIYKYREKWAKFPERKNLSFSTSKDRESQSYEQSKVLGEIYKSILKHNLSVLKKDKKLGIIIVTVVSPDEVFSKMFTETLVDQVSKFYVQTKTKKSLDNLKILQFQTDSVRRALNSAISGVAVSSDINPNANPALQILRVPSQKRTVDVQANQVILSELVKNLEIAKVTLRRDKPLIQIIDNPILPLDEIRPSKILSIGIGLIISLLLTITYLLIKKLLNE